MTSSKSSNIIKEEEIQSTLPNDSQSQFPPPINWATRPIPGSLSTMPQKQQQVGDPESELELNEFGSDFGLDIPLTHPIFHFVNRPSLDPREKYYVVYVGKCVGIFSFWPYVKSLTKDLKDATFQGFESFEVAADNYNKARSIGLLSIKRVPGEDLQYGPVSEGMQDFISL